MKIILVILINIIYYIIYTMGQNNIQIDIEADPPANNNQGSYSAEIKYFV